MINFKLDEIEHVNQKDLTQKELKEYDNKVENNEQLKLNVDGENIYIELEQLKYVLNENKGNEIFENKKLIKQRTLQDLESGFEKYIFKDYQIYQLIRNKFHKVYKIEQVYDEELERVMSYNVIFINDNKTRETSNNVKLLIFVK